MTFESLRDQEPGSEALAPWLSLPLPSLDTGFFIPVYLPSLVSLLCLKTSLSQLLHVHHKGHQNGSVRSPL